MGATATEDKEAKGAAVMGKAARLNIYTVDPDEVHIEETKGRPYFDERAFLPVDEATVQSIMLVGVFTPITVAAVDGKAVVVFGRQRIKAAREANKRLRAQGLVTVRVPCVYKRGEEAGLTGMMIAENELRTADDPMTKARKAQRLLDLGTPEDEAAIYFGIKPEALRNRLKLLELCKAVQKAVALEELSASAAIRLHGMSEADQEKALAEALAAGGTSRRDMTERVQATRAGARSAGDSTAGRARAVPKPRLQQLYKWAEKEQWLTREARAILGWVLGEFSDDDAKRVNGFSAFLDKEAVKKERTKAAKAKEKKATAE